MTIADIPKDILDKFIEYWKTESSIPIDEGLEVNRFWEWVRKELS